jgi:hypothetical protein
LRKIVLRFCNVTKAREKSLGGFATDDEACGESFCEIVTLQKLAKNSLGAPQRYGGLRPGGGRRNVTKAREKSF